MSSYINRRRFLTRAGLIPGGVVAGPCLLSACGGGGGGGASDTFKVGGVPQPSVGSGPGGKITQPRNQLWADAVNNKGGLSIGDKKFNVELVVQDCKSDPS